MPTMTCMFMLIVGMFALCLFSGCAGRQGAIAYRETTVMGEAVPEQVSGLPGDRSKAGTWLLQAKYDDLAVPLGFLFDIERSYSAHDAMMHRSGPYKNYAAGDVLCYHGRGKIEHVHAFFMRDMECAGWSIESVAYAPEVLLVCRKPSRLCVVSVRQVRGALFIYFFLNVASGVKG